MKTTTYGGDKFPRHFTGEINKLFQGLNFIQSYSNEFVVLTIVDCNDHLDKLEQVLFKLENI